MRKGDLVRYRGGDLSEVGLVVDITQKKVWRTWLKGKQIDWDRVDPEPHAVVLWEHNDGPLEVPFTELYLA